MTDPMELVDRLDQRAVAARSENTATALGDAIHFEQAAACIRDLVEQSSVLSEGLTICRDMVADEDRLFAELMAEGKHEELLRMDFPIMHRMRSFLSRYDELPTPPSKADRGGA